MHLSGAVLGGGFPIPHHSKFAEWSKFENVAAHEARLQRIGLSDPWKRNYAFAYETPGSWKVSRSHGIGMGLRERWKEALSSGE